MAAAPRRKRKYVWAGAESEAEPRPLPGSLWSCGRAGFEHHFPGRLGDCEAAAPVAPSGEVRPAPLSPGVRGSLGLPSRPWPCSELILALSYPSPRPSLLFCPHRFPGSQSPWSKWAFSRGRLDFLAFLPSPCARLGSRSPGTVLPRPPLLFCFFYSVPQTGLELSVQPRLALNLQQLSRLSLYNAGVTGVHHHAGFYA